MKLKLVILCTAGIALLSTALLVASSGPTDEVRSDKNVELGASDSQFDLVDEGINLVHGSIVEAKASDVRVEMGREVGLAHTRVRAEHYVYMVLLRESSPGSVQVGNFSAELLADGVSKGNLSFAQATPDPGVAAQVRLLWDLGAAPPTGTKYEVRLSPQV